MHIGCLPYLHSFALAVIGCDMGNFIFGLVGVVLYCCFKCQHIKHSLQEWHCGVAILVVCQTSNSQATGSSPDGAGTVALGELLTSASLYRSKKIL